ncbi:MAG TPA: DUF3299 domain-containing protein [Longimicrobiales bacterium]|nr:DUF3299 domain-containing protein [Longimicrobiales bacterium]
MTRRLMIGSGTARRTGSVLALGLAIVFAGMRPAAAPADMRGDSVSAEIERAIAAGDPVTLDWKTMAALDYKTGKMPESLKKLDGVLVRIPGFMVPLEDTETRVTEFLLVPYFGACIHTPPPPPNQMAHVLMERNETVDVNLWDPIWIIGELSIESVESPYGMVGYQVTGERILPYDG